MSAERLEFTVFLGISGIESTNLPGRVAKAHQTCQVTPKSWKPPASNLTIPTSFERIEPSERRLPKSSSNGRGSSTGIGWSRRRACSRCKDLGGGDLADGRGEASRFGRSTLEFTHSPTAVRSKNRRGQKSLMSSDPRSDRSTSDGDPLGSENSVSY